MERLLDYFIPSKYELNFHVNRDKTELKGETTIYGEAKTEQIKIHAVDMTIDKIEIDGIKTEYQHETGVIYLKTERGEHKITIWHHSSVDEDMQGAYLSKYQKDGKEEHLLTTQFESHYAREAFPCIDEPAAKAVYKISLTSDDIEDTLLSNMPIEQETVENGQKTAIFAKTPRMSSYLVAFIAGKLISYETSSKHGVKIAAYAVNNQKTEDLKLPGDFAADVLDYYDELFQTPYPLPKLDLVAIPDFDAGAMENWGLVTFREIAMLANEKSSIEQKIYISTVVAHELSHMWFGDLVTMKWWDDLWLNESFANTMELYSTAKVRPEYNAWDDFYTDTVQIALRRDCLPGVQPVHVDVENVEEIDTLFDGAIVYAKGGRMVVMLMHAMGEENFFKGLKDYFDQHKYSNTCADDLWNALTPYADFDVKEFMTPWLIQPGFPSIMTNMQQHRFLLAKNDEPNYIYPIRELKDDLSGHYLINYTEDELKEKLANMSVLSKEQKLRLLTDRRLLAKTSEVSSVSLLPLIEAFKDEDDVAIWEAIAIAVSDLKLFFDPNTKEKENFRRFIIELCKKQSERLGIEAKSDDTLNDIKLRPIIMGLMIYANDSIYIQSVVDKYISTDLKDMNPDCRWAIMSILARNDKNRAIEYFNIYKDCIDPELKDDLSGAMTSVMDRDILISFIKELKDGAIRPQDRLSTFAKILRNYRSTEDALDWMMQNWDWLAKTEGEKSIGMYPRCAATVIKTQQNTDKYIQFFQKYESDLSIGREVRVGIALLEAKLKLIQQDKDAIYNYLSGKYA